MALEYEIALQEISRKYYEVVARDNPDDPGQKYMLADVEAREERIQALNYKPQTVSAESELTKSEGIVEETPEKHSTAPDSNEIRGAAHVLETLLPRYQRLLLLKRQVVQRKLLIESDIKTTSEQSPLLQNNDTNVAKRLFKSFFPGRLNLDPKGLFKQQENRENEELLSEALKLSQLAIFELAVLAMPKDIQPLPELAGDRFNPRSSGYGIYLELPLGIQVTGIRSPKEAYYFNEKLGADFGISHDLVGRIPEPSTPEFVSEIIEAREERNNRLFFSLR